MPNWERIIELRNRLKMITPTTPHQFRMDDIIRIKRQDYNDINGTALTAEKLRTDPNCHSACCFVGEIFINFAPDDTQLVTESLEDGEEVVSLVLAIFNGAQRDLWNWAKEFLALTDDEAAHMFLGLWYDDVPISTLSLADGIAYLDKAIEHQKIEVTI